MPHHVPESLPLSTVSLALALAITHRPRPPIEPTCPRRRGGREKESAGVERKRGTQGTRVVTGESDDGGGRGRRAARNAGCVGSDRWTRATGSAERRVRG
jgi:hypothetical protein